jgi:hypothetical protein
MDAYPIFVAIVQLAIGITALRHARRAGFRASACTFYVIAFLFLAGPVLDVAALAMPS